MDDRDSCHEGEPDVGLSHLNAASQDG